MKACLALIITLFLAFDAYADSSVHETLSADRPDGSEIDYYLIPESPKGRSDVLLLVLQGSDCNSVLQIESVFKNFKNVWPKADLLLIEKYGIDQELKYDSNGERTDCLQDYLKLDSPEQRVQDITVVLDAVQKSRPIEKLVVIGGSEGAVIANLIAAKIDAVDATIAFNGGGRWFIDDVLHNIASEFASAEDAKESMEGFTGFSQHVLNSEPFDLQVSGHGYRWWKQMLSIDQLEVLKQVKSPLLIVQGGSDLSVSPKQVDAMILALSESENIEYRSYEGLDHGFKNSAGQSEVDSVVADMNAWLKHILDSQ